MRNPLPRTILATAVAIAGILALVSCSRDQRSAGPANTLTAANISFPGMQLRPDGSSASFTLIGRVRNRSAQATLTEVRLRMTMEDVLASGATTTVAETFVTLRKEVPPAESREFEEKVDFGRLPKPRGRLEWNYAVAGVKGK